jgi:predicted AlkP superfamily phosphohydrolase/phosphomutase
MVEMGTDRMQHGFRRFFDPWHRLHEAGNRFAQVALDYYRASRRSSRRSVTTGIACS